MTKVLLASLIILLAGPAPAQVNPGGIKWGPAPAALPKGSQVAVLAGNPEKRGTFVLRARMPAGYAVPPHHHPRAEYVTVISGQLTLGMGRTMRRPRMANLVAGGFMVTPANMNHYVYTRTGTTIQVSGEGPFEVVYVNPADDPRRRR